MTLVGTVFDQGHGPSQYAAAEALRKAAARHSLYTTPCRPAGCLHIYLRKLATRTSYIIPASCLSQGLCLSCIEWLAGCTMLHLYGDGRGASAVARSAAHIGNFRYNSLILYHVAVTNAPFFPWSSPSAPTSPAPQPLAAHAHVY